EPCWWVRANGARRRRPSRRPAPPTRPEPGGGRSRPARSRPRRFSIGASRSCGSFRGSTETTSLGGEGCPRTLLTAPIAGPPGFEPGLTDPESVGLPLPHGPTTRLRAEPFDAIRQPAGPGEPP